jgi:predicted ATPase
LQEILAAKLKEIGLAHSFEVERVEGSQDIYRVFLRINRDSDRILITDVGFGISQILPVLTMCYSVPEGSIVVFEQPEIHLHPRAASGLADVFIHASKMRSVQFIIESHSEHLLRRLQRRIAEQHNGLAYDDVALYFCSYEENESKLEPLNVDLYGDITNWPEDFFGDEFGEVALRQKAALERKLKDNV